MRQRSTTFEVESGRAPDARGARIAIVEDDPNVGGLLRVMFEQEGFAPVLLRDGRAAEEYVLAHGAPAAVILDANLPYRDGFAVATTIRASARWHAAPIVMLTGRRLEADVERALSLGIAHYVVKPFSPAAFAKLVRSVAAEAP